MANFTEKFIEELESLEALIATFPDFLGNGGMQGAVAYNPLPTDKATYNSLFRQLRTKMGETPEKTGLMGGYMGGMLGGFMGFGIMGFTFDDFFHEELITIDTLKKVFEKIHIKEILVTNLGKHYVKMKDSRNPNLSNMFVLMSTEGISDDIYQGMKLAIE